MVEFAFYLRLTWRDGAEMKEMNNYSKELLSCCDIFESLTENVTVEMYRGVPQP
jgi:hypothetical protein